MRLKHQSAIKRSSIGHYYGHQFNTIRLSQTRKHARTHAPDNTDRKSVILVNSESERECCKDAFVALNISLFCHAQPNTSILIIFFSKNRHYILLSG